MKRRRIVLGVAAVALMAFALGRASVSSPDVVVHERAEERVSEAVTEAKTATETSSATEAVDWRRDEVRVVHRAPSRTVFPDGRVEERGAELELAASSEQLLQQLQAESRRQEQEVRVEVREVERLVEQRMELRTPAPAWRAGALVGLEIRGGLPVYGAQVERRALGPISVGAWGLSNGAAGVSLGMVW